MNDDAEEEFEGFRLRDDAAPAVVVVPVAFAGALPIGDNAATVVEDEGARLRADGYGFDLVPPNKIGRAKRVSTMMAGIMGWRPLEGGDE